MREHIAIERIQRGIVDVRGQDTLFQIVEDDHADRATQPTKRALVQLRPDLGARSPDEQPDRLARAAERQDEEARASVLPGASVTDHRPFAVVDLAFLTGRRRDDDARVRRRIAAQGHDEATDTRIPPRKAVVVDQVLPDGDGVAATRQAGGDELAIRLAGARTRGSARRRRTHRVGGHLLARNGRFCPEVGGHLLGNGRFWF